MLFVLDIVSPPHIKLSYFIVGCDQAIIIIIIIVIIHLFYVDKT